MPCRGIKSTSVAGAVISVAGALFLFGCQTTRSPETGARFFKDVAFNASVGGHPVSEAAAATGLYQPEPLHRWEGPIRYSVAGMNAADHEARVAAVFGRVGSASGLEVSAVAAGDQAANFVLTLVDAEGFTVNGTENAACYSHTLLRGSEITSVEIKISRGQEDDLIEYCLAHEVMHGMGFAHARGVSSVLSYASMATDFTAWDILALEVLYDSRLKSGMTVGEAMPIARELIESKILAEGG